MKRRTVKRILTYVRPYRAAFAASCASALLYVLFTLLGPVFTGRAIDNILGPGQVDLRGVLYYLALLGISVLLAAASQWVMNVCTRKISSRASNDMRGEAFRVLNRTPLKYIDGHTHGDIISRMVNDADLVAEGLLQGLTQLLPGVATILGTLVVMAVLNPVIALVVVLVTPVSIAFAGFVARRTTGFFKAQSAAQGRLSGFVNEMVAGQSVVKAFGYEDRCFAQFDAISDELYDTGLKSVFYSSVTNPGTRFVNAIVYAAVGVIGAISAIGGSITVGQLSCFLTYANQYTKPFNEVTGVLTGKGLSYGGSLVRPEATGYGLCYFTQEALRCMKQDSFEGKTVVVSGSGNVAIYATEKATQLGGKVVALSDSNGYIYDKNGVNLDVVKAIKLQRRGRISEYVKEVPGAEYHEGCAGIWGIPCDIALPCATQNEIDGESAKKLAANGCKVVCEGANMPSTPEAIAVYEANGILYGPAKAANAGGVATSGLEMSQNSLRLSWSFEEVDARLQDIMTAIFHNAYDASKACGAEGNLMVGANVAGFIKVADAMLAQGVAY